MQLRKIFIASKRLHLPYRRRLWVVRACIIFCAAASLAGLSGCGLSTGQQTSVWGAVAVTIAARSPSNEFEQTYYLGVFDPQDQLPPTFYRLRVRGQASALSLMRFSSGWVRAEVIDSLGTSVRFNKTGTLDIEKANELSDKLQTGRRLIMFGPEGFREAPADHRLVLVMGSSPEKFFEAVDQSLGTVASAIQGRRGVDFENEVFKELVTVRNERQRLSDILTEARLEEARETGR
jgi:hypothetical protein